MPTAVIVPAAGRGARLGPGAPKALREIAGVPLLVHAVHGLCDSDEVDLVVVAAPPGDAAAVETLLLPAVGDVALTVVDGGEARQQSVAAALRSLPEDVDVVLVHDAARAFTPPEVFARVVAAVRSGAEAVIPVLPVADTVKQVSAGTVEATLDRTSLRAVQTPQGFRRDVLVRAHASSPAGATDDASLAEALGVAVAVVDGSDEAFKVTRPLDLLLAEALLHARARSAYAEEPGPGSPQAE